MKENPYQPPHGASTTGTVVGQGRSQSQKIMSIVGWVLSGLLGAALVMSAGMKFFPPEEMVKQMKDSPVLGWILIIGIGEVARPARIDG